MKRRRIAVGLGLVFLAAPLTGCSMMGESSSLRSKSSAPAKSDGDERDGDAGSVSAVDSEAPKKFFSSTRLSGAMSSEGRDIERSLGVN